MYCIKPSSCPDFSPDNYSYRYCASRVSSFVHSISLTEKDIFDGYFNELQKTFFYDPRSNVFFQITPSSSNPIPTYGESKVAAFLNGKSREEALKNFGLLNRNRCKMSYTKNKGSIAYEMSKVQSG